MHVHEDIIAVFEVIWIPIGLFWLKSFWSSELCLVVIEIVAISASRWLESFIVPSWVESGSSTSFAWLCLGSSTKAPNLATDEHALR